MAWDLPKHGLVFWPVGNGDSTTVVIDQDTLLQVDLNHRSSSEEDDTDTVPVVDRLLDVLDPDDPRLDVLAITHHDEDHCTGFERLNDEVAIGELWITLRSFVEEKDEPGGLTAAGQAVYDEAKERRAAEIKAAAHNERAPDGKRLRVVGVASVLEHGDWEDFPEDLLVVPGDDPVTTVNEKDVSDRCSIFVHTPYRDATESDDRNSSSLGMHITLTNNGCEQRVLLLGDLDHEQIKAFFEKTESNDNDDKLGWDVLLAPHHGSRHAVFHKADDGNYVRADAADKLEEYAADGAKVIVSSKPVEELGPDDSGPPNEAALELYADMVGEDNLHKVADYADGSDSAPLTIEVGGDNCGQVRETAALAAWTTVRPRDRGRVRSGDPTTGRRTREFA